MFKRGLIAIALLFVCGTSFADNSARIKELSDQIEKGNKQYAQYAQEMKVLEQQILMASGAVMELKNQDLSKDGKVGVGGKEEKDGKPKVSELSKP